MCVRLSRYRTVDPAVTFDKDGPDGVRSWVGAASPRIWAAADDSEATLDVPEYDVRKNMATRDPWVICLAFEHAIKFLLARLLGVQRARINSLHNQAINQLGEGLVVSARDLEQITQAIEAPGRRFVMGVQWHPEFLLFLPSQRRLFKALVSAARELG